MEINFFWGIELLLLGLASGYLAGLLGIGGGMMLVPFLNFLLEKNGTPHELAIKMAIATATATIVMTSLSSIWAHQKQKMIQWKSVQTMAPGVLLGALLASCGVFYWVSGQALALFFGVFVSYSAWKMLRPSIQAHFTATPASPLKSVSAGVGIGFLSGLVGAGGGFLTVPFLTRHAINIRQAVATSAALGFPIAFFNTLGFMLGAWHLKGLPAHSLGYIYLPAWLILVMASMSAAPQGAKMAHQLPIALLKRIFACLLLLLAIYMFFQAF